MLLIHLLKWQLQPRRRSRSCNDTIISQRIEIDGILGQSPSLLPKICDYLVENYKDAVRLAVIETGLPVDRFPGECPFTVEQLLDPEFLP